MLYGSSRALASRHEKTNLKCVGWHWVLMLVLLLVASSSASSDGDTLNEVSSNEVRFVLSAAEDVVGTSTRELNLFESSMSNITKSVGTKKIPAQVELTAQVGIDQSVTLAGKLNGSPKHTGELNHTDFGESLGKVPKLIFTSFGGTGKKKKKKKMEFKRVDANVPVPQFWKMNENGDLFGEDAQVWYGVNGTASAVVMVNTVGDIVGSVNDGTDSFSFQTEFVNNYDLSSFNVQQGEKKTKYSVTGIKDLKMGTVLTLPTNQSNELSSINGNQEINGNTRRTLRGDARRTQTDCDDIEGW